MALTDDILAKIRHDFRDGETPSIIELLADLQRQDPSLFSDRILRCVVFIAQGKFGRLSDAVAVANRDPRDLIVWAEYDGHFGIRHRDLSLPFSSWDMVPPAGKSL